MDIQNSSTEMRKQSLILFLIGIIFVSFNLRPAITSVGPLVGMIQEDIGLAHWSIGFLTSLPLICFAGMSPLVPKIANRLNNERTLLLGLVIIAVGIVIRYISMAFFLFAGTFFAGIGIAICNVLIPVVIKEKFPMKFGLMTSVYTTSMSLVASLASGFSVPLAKGMNLGWQMALLIWVIPAIVAIFIWVYLLNQDKSKIADFKMVESKRSEKGIWFSPLAWQVALLLGFQSFLFYVTITWLPEILLSHGIRLSTAGWLLSLTQFIGLPAGFIIPVMAGRFRTQGWIVAILGILDIVGYGGLLFDLSFPMIILCISLIGIGLGGCFPLCLTLLGMRSRNARQAAELSGMAQSVGYLSAAIGPMFIGFLFDFTHMWTVPLMTLLIVTVLVIIFGFCAGRNKYV